MYVGQVDTISNRATWASETYELVDDQDGTTVDLTDPSLTVDIVVTIRGRSNGSWYDYNGVDSIYSVLATASLANGKVTIPGPGFQWQFEDTDLSGLCAGTYKLGAKVTINGFINDIIIGTIAVLEGN
jgi:hypothetical protein